MRFLAFLAVTVIGVPVANLGLVIAGWPGALAAFGLVFWAYRALSRRFGESSAVGPLAGDRLQPSTSAGPFIPREVLWSAFAMCAYLGSCVGAIGANNPDGYMQPRSDRVPWEFIILGTAAGIIAGLGLVALLTFFNWLEKRGRRSAVPRSPGTISK